MGGNLADLQVALERARDMERELDKKVFYFKTLFETSRELNALRPPARILETFLLAAMGPLGITQAMTAMFNIEDRDGFVASRGFRPAEAAALDGRIPLICDRYFGSTFERPDSLPGIRMIEPDPAATDPVLPAAIQTLLLWNLDECYSGLVGLGPRLSGRPLDADDRDILQHLTRILLTTLSQALDSMRIEQLNAELGGKNRALELALEEAQDARLRLDKRVFHLKTLYDLALELSPIVQMDELLQSFLLTIMGTFGMVQGAVILYDRDSQSVQWKRRGVAESGPPVATAMDQLLYRCFEAMPEKTLNPMSVSRIARLQALDGAGFGFELEWASMFVVDQSLMGILALGAPVSGTPLSLEDDELLLTQMSNFTLSLNNSRSFEKIRGLNQHLEQKNTELEQTISELTRAKQEISALEKAKTRLRQLIYGELDRIDRVSAVDFVLISLLAALLGILFNLSSPNGIPLLPEVLFRPSLTPVSASEANALLHREKVLLVDARPQQFYQQGHIRGAVNVPPALFDLIYMMKLEQQLDESQKEIIVYGRNVSKLYDEEVAERLRQRDHENIRLLSGGLSAWQQQGYPVEP